MAKIYLLYFIYISTLLQNVRIHSLGTSTVHNKRLKKKKTDTVRRIPVSYAALGPLLFHATQSRIVTEDHCGLTVAVSWSHDHTLCVGWDGHMTADFVLDETVT